MTIDPNTYTRPGKIQNGDDIRKLNNVGDRMRWVRNTLELSQNKVSVDTGIPQSSYHGRENGARAIYPEEHLVLARYFDELWQGKFKGESFPKYYGTEIIKIKVAWLLFGVDE